MDLSDATFAELKQALRITAGGGVTLVLRPNDTLHEAHTVSQAKPILASTDTVLSMPDDFTSSA